ncbi:hypothetical protein FS764_00030 [Agrobacterium vitis]|uniref:hypothetical protein n=1 Tax=Agrobacterium vitis TaxID=373 RepID=UPI001F1CD069|nr:hypothetical protein [Agrobacterium vitis]MCF1465289.1 hypothetical protein [Agrobacterium vitis]
MDKIEKLARELFKEDFPNRTWDLVSSKPVLGEDLDVIHATEGEKEKYRELARRQLEELGNH